MQYNSQYVPNTWLHASIKNTYKVKVASYVSKLKISSLTSDQ